MYQSTKIYKFTLFTNTTTMILSKHSVEVATDLIDIDAIHFHFDNPITWSSGIQSPIYCDLRKVNTYVKVRNKIILYFHEMIEALCRDDHIDAIAGVATAGIPLASMMAYTLNKPLLYVRPTPKKHGLKKQIEGDFKEGDKVLLIEELVSTGKSALAAINALQEKKLQAKTLLSLMTYDFPQTRQLFLNTPLTHLSLCNFHTIGNACFVAGKMNLEQRSILDKFNAKPYNWQGNLINRHEKGMPLNECKIIIVYHDHSGTQLIPCDWHPFNPDNYSDENIPAKGYLGTAEKNTGEHKGIGFHAWEQNDYEFTEYYIDWSNQ